MVEVIGTGKIYVKENTTDSCQQWLKKLEMGKESFNNKYITTRVKETTAGIIATKMCVINL